MYVDFEYKESYSEKLYQKDKNAKVISISNIDNDCIIMSVEATEYLIKELQSKVNHLKNSSK